MEIVVVFDCGGENRNLILKAKLVLEQKFPTHK